MRAGHVLEVIINGAWKIAQEDRQLRPYPTEEVLVEPRPTGREAGSQPRDADPRWPPSLRVVPPVKKGGHVTGTRHWYHD